VRDYHSLSEKLKASSNPKRQTCSAVTVFPNFPTVTWPVISVRLISYHIPLLRTKIELNI
jgi:hypothetical protein